MNGLEIAVLAVAAALLPFACWGLCRDVAGWCEFRREWFAINEPYQKYMSMWSHRGHPWHEIKRPFKPGLVMRLGPGESIQQIGPAEAYYLGLKSLFVDLAKRLGPPPSSPSDLRT